MALAPWPVAMRASGSAAVSGGPQNNVVSFDPDVGPSIVRRRATSFMRTYKIDFVALTLAEYTAFVEFFHDTLRDGTLPFAWSNPLTGAASKAQFVLSASPAYTEARLTKDLFNLSFEVRFTVLP